jgi:hypothetical protein
MLQNMLNAVPHIRKVHAPTLYTILAVDSVPHHSYDVSFETAANYDIVIIHASWTPGNPKPIGWNTKYLSKMNRGNDLPVHQGEPLVETTFSKENALGLLLFFHVSAAKFYLLRQRRMLTVILVGWTDLPYIRYHI